MNRAEEDIALMNRLYDCRRAARGILGDSYTESLQPWRDLILRVMKIKKLRPLQAVLDICKHIGDDGLQLMLVFAAGVDVIELPTPASADAREETKP